MDVYDFFNKNKPIVRKTISGGTTNGRVMMDETPKKPNRRDEFSHTTEYAEEHVTENERQMVDVS